MLLIVDVINIAMRTRKFRRRPTSLSKTHVSGKLTRKHENAIATFASVAIVVLSPSINLCKTHSLIEQLFLSSPKR
jgi:hypothetical protein